MGDPEDAKTQLKPVLEELFRKRLAPRQVPNWTSMSESEQDRIVADTVPKMMPPDAHIKQMMREQQKNLRPTILDLAMKEYQHNVDDLAGTAKNMKENLDTNKDGKVVKEEFL